MSTIVEHAQRSKHEAHKQHRKSKLFGSAVTVCTVVLLNVVIINVVSFGKNVTGAARILFNINAYFLIHFLEF